MKNKKKRLSVAQTPTENTRNESVNALWCDKIQIIIILIRLIIIITEKQCQRFAISDLANQQTLTIWI